MLRLPSLDLVFSSKSTDCELDESSLNNSEGAFKFNNSPRTGWMTEDSSPDQDHSRGMYLYTYNKLISFSILIFIEEKNPSSDFPKT